MFTHENKAQEDGAWRSRRNFLQLSAGAAAGALAAATGAAASVAAAIVQPAMLFEGWNEGPHPADAVVIDQNENPLGPCVTAREAAMNVVAQGGR